MNYSEFSFFKVEKDPATKTATLWLNKPEKKNVLTWDFWMGLPLVVEALEQDPEVRVVVVAGMGGHFSIGIDFKDFMQQVGATLQGLHGENREMLFLIIRKMQQGFLKIANSNKVYIAAVQGYCLGGGLDLICACDLRLADNTAIVSVRETKVAIVADMGSLQRLPFIVGQANARLMAYTGRDFNAETALQMGLYNQVYAPNELLTSAQALAAEIAENSAITLRGVKQAFVLNESRSPEEGMRDVALWNASFLQTKDFEEALTAFFEKRKPNFMR